MIWLAQNGRSNAPATVVAFDPRSRTFGPEIPIGRVGNNTIRHMTFDAATRQLWFGTDQGTIGRVPVPQPVLLK
ncbi:MAG: hypothetical protein U5K74_12185 [Gemmatimonadaceae bacterium]|nr:hypothetical protein [Gemmatimonadaceae bacterium]